MRAGLLTAAFLLAACAGAPSPTPSVVPAEPVRTLATGLSAAFAQNPFVVTGATNADDYAALWQTFGLRSLPPEVDFEREIVVYLGMAGSGSCPEVFQRLVVDHEASTVHAEWQPHPPNQACTDDLQSQGVLLAVSRAELPTQQFALSLRAQPICADCPTHPDRAIIDPTL